VPIALAGETLGLLEVIGATSGRERAEAPR
jgi:hypothetical protein